MKLSPLNNLKKIHDINRLKEKKFIRDKNLENILISQDFNKILKGQNQIFDNHGGLNSEFFNNLTKMNDKNYGILLNKCYDIKQFEKFNIGLKERINKFKNEI